MGPISVETGRKLHNGRIGDDRSEARQEVRGISKLNTGTSCIHIYTAY